MLKRSGSGFTLIELAIVIAIIGILAAVAVPRFQNLTSQAEDSVARSLLQSLQSSAAIYVAQQRVPPTAFDDFVLAAGAASGAYTLTLENVGPQTTGMTIPAASNAGLTVTFTGGGVATYWLNGTDVTAGFVGF